MLLNFGIKSVFSPLWLAPLIEILMTSLGSTVKVRIITNLLTPWSYIFPFALWYLWKHRNRVVFENTTMNPNLHKQCINQALEYFYCVGKMQRSMMIVTVRWNKPPYVWFKLNNDGASMGELVEGKGRRSH